MTGNLFILLARALTLATIALFVAGCMYTAANTAVKAGSVNRYENKKHFQAATLKGYGRYLDLAEQSGCDASEYLVNDSVYQFALDHDDNRLTQTIDRLKKVVADSSSAIRARSDAAYYLALIYMRPNTENPYMARLYIDRLTDDFAGTRDCIAGWLEQHLVNEEVQRY